MKKNALFYFIPLILILFLLTNCKSSEKKAASKPKTSTSGTAGRSNDSEKINKVIKTAKSYVGTPYKYGGMTRSGMDCSGLLINSFKAIDYQLPRTSVEQSKIGKSIAVDDLKKGDLVFFSEKKSVNKISHVGLVTEVKGKKDVKFIHASTKLGVVENDLYAPYYIKIFVKAVRPLH